MEQIRSYQDLKVWQHGIGIAVDCYRVTSTFPKEELYGLVSQIRRASSSVPANIAEGHGRGSTKEYAQFLRTARGSLYELETHLILSRRIGFISDESIQPLFSKIDELGRMLNALHKVIQAK